MVTRNITQQRQVTRVAAGQDPNLAEIGRQTFTKVMDATNAAKIQKNISQAQIEIDDLTRQYRLDNEGDPYGNQEAFDRNREAILNRFGNEIPSMYSNAWNAEAQNLTNRSKQANGDWAFKQSQINTVNNVNDTIQTNLSGAVAAGRAFGGSIGSDVGDVMNFQASRQRLTDFGNKHIGEGKTAELMQNYDSDYLKSFMGGLIETNPLKANELLKNEKVRKTIGTGYGKLKEATMNKIDNLGKAKSQQEVLDAMAGENNLLKESLVRNLSPTELQQAFSTGDFSEGAQKYLLRINGYSKDRNLEKKTTSDKLRGKIDYISRMTAFTESEKSKTPDEYRRMQNAIYEAMDAGYITSKEGTDQIAQLIEPYAENLSKDLEQFSDDYLQVDNSLGFGRIEKYFEDELALGVTSIFGLALNEDDDFEVINDQNQVQLYSFYYDSLRAQASARGTTIAGLSGIATKDKQAVLDKAYNDAVTSYAQKQGLGSFDDAASATEALSRDAQQRALNITQTTIDAAYSEPEPNKEVDDFLGEFGL